MVKEYKPWGKQKELMDERRMPTSNDILIKARRIKDIRNRALFCMMYLTAGRITEIVNYNKITYKKGKAVRERKPKISIRKCDIETTYMKGKKVMLIKMPNRKNRVQKEKHLPVPIDKEKPFIDIIKKYTDTLKDDDPLFNIVSSTARDIIRKETEWGCHWTRHIRLTHLKKIHGLRETEIKKWAGWSDLRPWRNYEHLDTEDMVY